jgi:predicted acyl esterase
MSYSFGAQRIPKERRMSDIDRPDGAWIVPPSTYLASRPAEFSVPPAPTSCYVTMRDGCRLAVDVYLPVATLAGASWYQMRNES